jgi:hypothetical protein
VKAEKAQYRILYNEEMDILFNGAEAPLVPIETWLRDRIKMPSSMHKANHIR